MQNVGASQNNLIRENQRLKQRIAELEAKRSPISANPETGEIQIDDLSVGGMDIEKLRVRVSGLRAATTDVGDIGAWAKGRPNLAPLTALAQKPLVVDELKARIPLPLVNSMMDQIAGDQLKKAGLSEVRLSQGEGGEVRVRGMIQKGLTLPFEVNGNLSTTTEGKVKFKLLSSRLAGFPMPNLLVSIATRFAGDSLDKAGVTFDNNEFTLDPQQFKPKNVHFQLEELSVHDGAVTIGGAAPVSSET
jgi:hypothetical protein